MMTEKNRQTAAEPALTDPAAEQETATTTESAPEQETAAGRHASAQTAGRRRFPSIGDLFAMLGIVLGLQIVVGLVGAMVLLVGGRSLAELEPAATGRFLAVTYLFSMLPAYLAIRYYRRARGGEGPLLRFSRRGLNPALLLWAFVLMIAAGIVCEPLLALLPPAAPNVGRGLWTIVALVVMAPVLEELICRGVVLGSLRERYGVVTAWLVSSLFFGVLHVQPVLVVNAFVVGLILGFIYIATDSLWSVIILHALNNAIAYLMLVTGNGEQLLLEMVGNRTVYVLIFIAALAVTAISGYMVWRTLARLKEQEKNSAAA